jgi:molecular chaperone IbpA
MRSLRTLDRSFDLNPLYRSTVGFDNIFSLLDTAMKMDEAGQGYPPYNIEKKSEDAYRITMAVAGFSDADLHIVAEGNGLVVAGQKTEQDGEQPSYLHRGIAARAFERRFQLADHVKVTSASMENGLLHIDLLREVPEAQKPRAIKISVTSGETPKTVEGQPAETLN